MMALWLSQPFIFAQANIKNSSAYTFLSGSSNAYVDLKASSHDRMSQMMKVV